MDMTWLFQTPVAHRGLHDDILPENSIPAFRAALERGFNIEIDVHLSSDGHLVVFHDDNLKRVCGVDKKVAKCTLEELRTMRLKGTENTIPTFDEFLALVDGKVDAVILDRFPAEAITANYDGQVKILETPVFEDAYAFAVAEGNTGLAEWINEAIAKMKEDGFWDSNMEKWFGSAEV